MKIKLRFLFSILLYILKCGSREILLNFKSQKNNFGNSIALESKGSNYVPNKLMLLS